MEISARPLAKASVKSVGRVQIVDHSPVCRVRVSYLGNYLILDIDISFLFSILTRTSLKDNSPVHFLLFLSFEMPYQFTNL